MIIPISSLGRFYHQTIFIFFKAKIEKYFYYNYKTHTDSTLQQSLISLSPVYVRSLSYVLTVQKFYN